MESVDAVEMGERGSDQELKILFRDTSIAREAWERFRWGFEVLA